MAEKRRTDRYHIDTGSLFFRMSVISTLVWGALLAVMLASTLHISLRSLQNTIENDLMATTVTLAGSDVVEQSVRSGRCPEDLMNYLDRLVQQMKGLNALTIADSQSIRIYHVKHERIGQPFAGGDQYRALDGERYFSDAEGTLGMQHRAFAPILSDSGAVMGFVMAGTTMDQLRLLRRELLHSYGILTLILLAATLAVSGGLTIAVQQVFHGFSPEGLNHAYLTRQDVLENMDEGVLSVDAAGCVKLMNGPAERILERSAAEMEGRPLDELLRDENGGSLLLPRVKKNIATALPNILAHCIPQKKKGECIGTTLLLVDKSEALRMAEQLNGTRHIITALRANNHEFMNKLQVIGGLLQIGRPEEAVRYIDTISAIHASATGPILNHIRNPSVAALLLGKLNNMREREIQMTLLPNSSLPPHSSYLSTENLVTVTGNLLENAIEAVNLQNEEAARSIVLQITEDEAGLSIMVTDTGVGIPPELLERIYERSFSTKGSEDRGVGMCLVKEIVDLHRGSIEVDSEPGEGTTFTLIFSEKRRGKQHDPNHHCGG